MTLVVLFLKGKNVDNELNLAKKTHRFNYTGHSSLTSEESKIILIFRKNHDLTSNFFQKRKENVNKLRALRA